jgi:phosphohistidine phosphatase
MKTLHLLRHAKSSWASPGVDDHERELNDRGRRDAPRMGRALADLVSAQPVHCSSAVRARMTLEGLCDGWPALALQPHVSDGALYTFDWEDLLVWLQDLQGQDSAVFLIGHNPAFTELCNALCGRRALDNLPTAGYLQLCLPIESWSEVTEGIARLEAWQFPRDLP